MVETLYSLANIYIYIYMQIPNLVSSYPPESKDFDDGLLCTCIWFIPKVTSSSTIDSDVTVFGDVKRHLKNSRNVSHSAFGSTDQFWVSPEDIDRSGQYWSPCCHRGIPLPRDPVDYVGHEAGPLAVRLAARWLGLLLSCHPEPRTPCFCSRNSFNFRRNNGGSPCSRKKKKKELKESIIVGLGSSLVE